MTNVSLRLKLATIATIGLEIFYLLPRELGCYSPLAPSPHLVLMHAYM